MKNLADIINRVHCADCLEFMRDMPGGCVDCVVTSPPYWGLRAYGTKQQIWGGDKECGHEWGREIVKGEGYNNTRKRWNHGAKREDSPETWNQSVSGGQFCIHCSAWRGELGLEPTIELYISHLIQVFGECERLLKKTGTMWINIGDSYAGSWGAMSHDLEGKAKRMGNSDRPPQSYNQTVPSKSLCQIPERLSIALTDQLGLIKRNTIIWHKRNCMPSSASDRFTVDFEYLFFFTKSGDYWFEQQFDPMNYPERIYASDTSNHKTAKLREQGNRSTSGLHDGRSQYGDPDLGRNKRCVWDIPTEASPEPHFAVFPRALVYTPIKAGCPPQGVVLDPFAGIGTTCLEAKEQGKNYIGIELSPEYIKIAEKKLGQEVLPFNKSVNQETQEPLFSEAES